MYFACNKIPILRSIYNLAKKLGKGFKSVSDDVKLLETFKNLKRILIKMEISIKSKKNGAKSGYIKSPILPLRCLLKINYQSNPQFFVDLQKLLLKYYDLKILSGEGNVGSKYILKELRKNYKTKKR